MDHYSTLGVSRDASPDDIKRAYRKLASQNHPDRGGDTAKFQQIQAAYDTLSDAERRHQYDNPIPQGFPGGFSFNFGQGLDPFSDFINQFTRQQRVYTAQVTITLEQLATQNTIELQFQTEHGLKMITASIPPNVQDGQRVRYGGIIPDGPLDIIFRVHPHPKFQRNGVDITETIEVNIWDLILGTRIHITTIRGQQVEVNILPKTAPGATLRLAGLGLDNSNHRGDHFLLIKTRIPDIISAELLDLIDKERSSK